MGTWSLPQTKKSAKELAVLMANPLKADDAIMAIYHLLGDDELHDDIDDQLRTLGPRSDTRPLIAARLQEFLDDYAERPESYLYVWQPAALKICHNIVKQFFH
ncbi:MAG: hypothetical protein NC218_04360 [Acetobacter sp.]|nr:hypothetical protein [Acetobacter sp.]